MNLNKNLYGQNEQGISRKLAKVGALYKIDLFVMKKMFFAFLIVFCACSENINYSKDNHFTTHTIKKGLYLEFYQTYAGGVYGGDVYTVYLTDSVSFRKYVGKESYDDQRIYGKEVDEDTYVVYKVEARLFSNKEKIIEKKTYSISALQKEEIFE